jgi:hypothetical protein
MRSTLLVPSDAANADRSVLIQDRRLLILSLITCSPLSITTYSIWASARRLLRRRKPFDFHSSQKMHVCHGECIFTRYIAVNVKPASAPLEAEQPLRFLGRIKRMAPSCLPEAPRPCSWSPYRFRNAGQIFVLTGCGCFNTRTR